MAGVEVLISDKYNPEQGLSVFSCHDCEGLTDQLNKFHSGEINSSAIAYSIIEALFTRDFSFDPKWDVNSATCKLLDEERDYVEGQEFPVSYQCEQSATWDYKDIYAVASSKAKIVVFSRDLIHIVLYSYYVAG